MLIYIKVVLNKLKVAGGSASKMAVLLQEALIPCLVGLFLGLLECSHNMAAISPGQVV